MNTVERKDKIYKAFQPIEFAILCINIIPRTTAEELLRQHPQYANTVLSPMTKEEIIIALINVALSQDKFFEKLLKILDKTSKLESSLIASLPENDWLETLLAMPALKFRKQGAKLVWALFSHEHRGNHVGQVYQKYHRNLTYQDELRDQASPDETGALHASLEDYFADAANESISQQKQLLKMEQERAQLLTNLGKSQKTIRELQTTLNNRNDQQIAMSNDDTTSEVKQLEKQLKTALAENDKLQNELLKQHEVLTQRSSKILASFIATIKPEIHALLDISHDHYQPPITITPLHDPEPPIVCPQKNESIAIFTDVANIAGAARNLYNHNVDFQKLLQVIHDNRKIIINNAYAIDKERGFSDFSVALEKFGYRVFGKKLKTYRDGSTKANWDIEIVVDMLSSKEHFDTCILISGDGDFAPALHYLKKQGKRIEIAGFKEHTHASLLELSDHFYQFNENILLDTDIQIIGEN